MSKLFLNLQFFQLLNKHACFCGLFCNCNTFDFYSQGDNAKRFTDKSISGNK